MKKLKNLKIKEFKFVRFFKTEKLKYLTIEEIEN